MRRVIGYDVMRFLALALTTAASEARGTLEVVPTADNDTFAPHAVIIERSSARALERSSARVKSGDIRVRRVRR